MATAIRVAPFLASASSPVNYITGIYLAQKKGAHLHERLW
jgi:hypothetical protein